MKPNQYIKYLGLALLVSVFASCSKMDATYDEFLENGETIYVGKAESVAVYSGNNRVGLQWVFRGDPKITKYKIYYNNRLDSIVSNFTRTSGVDTVKVIVDKNLKQGPINFEIFTFDKDGNRSVKVEALGNVYGASFQSEIYNRGLRPLGIWNEGTTITLNWFPRIAGEVKTELTYTNTANVSRKLIIPPTQMATALTDAKAGSNITVRSFYIPDSLAVDTFAVTAINTFKLPFFDKKLDKTLFKSFEKLNTAGTGPSSTGATLMLGDQPTGFQWFMRRLWDNDLNAGFASANVTATPAGVNRWFTFDLGVEKNLSRYRVWQTLDRMYRDENALEWEIWGSAIRPVDGSYTIFTKLLTCKSIKPSGAALGTVTKEDSDFANAGQELNFPDGNPPVRYIRIKVLKNYANQTFMTFGEMTFYTKD